MSTQKRASRSLPATETCRRGLRFRRQRMSCTERAGEWGNLLSTPFARYGCAGAGGGTAPLLLTFWLMGACFHPSDEDLSLGTPEELATKFLQADLPLGQRVRPLFAAERTGSPPPLGAWRPLLWRGAFGASVSPRSSLPPIPFPSGTTCLHLTLPQAPDANQRRAERYDGKRDLYFFNAA
jgi:hypothetical protein